MLGLLMVFAVLVLISAQVMSFSINGHDPNGPLVIMLVLSTFCTIFPALEYERWGSQWVPIFFALTICGMAAGFWFARREHRQKHA